MPYIFSGSLSSAMSDYLVQLKEAGKFEPMDVLVSQLDKTGIKDMLANMEKGIVKSLFIDSGAYSIHSQGFEAVSKGRFSTIDEFIDNYIDYVNSIDDKTIAVAQVDHIPGVFKQAKKPEDYEESAKLSWDNFLYMYKKMKSPDKLIAVFHQGESFEHLRNMLEWTDEDGNKLSYIGISPSNDRDVKDKDIYLRDVYDFIKRSSNPNVRTHLFGYTSLPGLTKFPWYSCDSVSHRLRAGYNKMFTVKWGTISLSKTRIAKDKASQCFLDICDADTLKEFTEFCRDYGFEPEQLCDDSSARTCIDICEVQKFVRENPYKPTNMLRQKRLLPLPSMASPCISQP